MKNHSIAAALAALSLSLAAVQVQAEDGYDDYSYEEQAGYESEVDNSHFYVGGSTGYFKPDTDRMGGNTRTLGAQIGYQFNERWSAELGYQMDAFSPGKDDLKTWDLEFIRHWGDEVRFLIEFGFTHVNLDANGPDDATAGFHIGAGVSAFLTDNLELRGDAKLIQTRNEGLLDGLGTVSLNYHFGKTTAIREESEPLLGSSEDSGSETLPAMDEYREPMPAEEPVAVAEPVPAEEPTPTPVPVAEEPVLEAAPAPAPIPVAPVAVSGTPRSVHTLVNFDSDSVDVNARYGAQLDQISSEIVSSNSRAVVEGHTDSQGADLYNKTLSVDRAIVVKRELKKRGVSGDDLSIVGYGEERPVATNDTEEGRQQNRRVEVKVYDKQ